MKKVLISLLIFMAILISIHTVNAKQLNMSNFSDEKFLCVELSQEFSSGDYTLTKEIEWSDNEGLAAFQSGLGHILEYDCSCDRKIQYGDYDSSTGTWSNLKSASSSANCTKQLALWAYLEKYQTEANSFFGAFSYDYGYRLIIESGYIKRLDHVDALAKGGYAYYEDGWLKTKKNYSAYILYAEAILKRAELNKYEFDIDVYERGDNQTVIQVNTAEKDDGVDVNLTFKKQNFSGSGLSNAEITVEGVENVSSITGELKKTTADGNLGTITVTVADNTDNTFEIKVKEIQAPDDYNKINGGGEVILTVTYDADGNVTNVSADKSSGNFGFTSNNIILKDDSRVVTDSPDYTIVKTDTMGNKIKDAEFKLEFTNIDYVIIGGITYTAGSDGTKTVTGLKTNSSGKIVINKIVAADGKTEVTMKATETSPAPGYSGVTDSLTLKWTYSTTNRAWGLNDPTVPEYWEVDKSTATITVENDRKIGKLTLLKLDSVDENLKLQGAKFTVTLENVKSIDGYSSGTESGKIILTGITTDGDGELYISGLVVDDISKDIIITIEETEAPTKEEWYYKVIENPITITLIASSDYESANIEDASESTTVDVKDNEVSIIVKNQPYIDLSGMVWEDGQTGDKNALPPDGVRYNEEGIPGVNVYLYYSNGSLVTGIENPVKTGANGEYKFEGLLRQKDGGYVIKFEYNGIWYEDVGITGDQIMIDGTIKYGSDAEEYDSDRDEFNDRFTTITNGQSNDGTKLDYEYADSKSTLNAEIDGTNPVDDKNFKITSNTGICNTTNINLDCGLARKEVDLAAVMLVDSTTLEINDKTTKYNHQKTLEENLEDIGISDLEEIKNNTVTTYLEYSDYYYRIEDYTTSSTEIKNEDPSDITTNVKELDVYVTYKLELINQTINNGVTINELAYYYDKNYTLEGIGTEIDETGKVINNSTIKREALPDALGKNAIKVSGFNGESKGKAVIETLYFTFKVNETEDGLPEAIATEQGLNCANVVEITSYSTTNSLIDRDSEPGNLLIKGTEDDSPQSNGLKIILKTTERTIEGTVFEDTNKDGVLDEEDQKVDNVIVQLIEIRSKASGGLGEYIWQQTESGSNNVKSLTNKGTEIRNYSHTGENAVGQGEYKFTGFVPGNYIIRYIYGDGTTYDFDAEGNVAKYNGQDYKSTKDPNYQAPLYNTAVYADGSSVARDNEARRLEVMAYSTTIDAKIGQALNTFSKNMEDLTDGEKAVLNSYYNSLDKNNIEVKFAYNASKGDAYAGNPVPATLSDDEIYNLLKYYVSYKTWMSAETSMINVPVDTEETSIDTNSTQVGIEYIDSNVLFGNMNFGLALRPNTKLVLEKHITGLKITPSGTGVQPIVDARKEISAYYDEDSNNDSPTGITTGLATIESTRGLATIESTRGERGFWKVETDIEELAQGAQLEVEYTYVIRNDGEEKDYLSKILVNAYEGYQTNDDGTRSEEKLDKTYKEYLESLIYDTRGKTNSYGTYLGQHYYTGNVGTTDAEVSSRVEGLEEALNNQLKYDDAGDYFKITNKDDEGKVISVSRNIYDTDGNLVDNVGNGIKNIETVVTAVNETGFMETGDKDLSRTLRLTTVLSSVTGDAGYYPSYIAEITKYSNAAGRRNMYAEPADLSYVHSEATEITMETHNEVDEFWGEQIIISKPTGEDKLTTLQIAIITITSVAAIGAGIVLIKKFVLKK